MGAIDAANLAPQLQILVAQVRLPRRHIAPNVEYSEPWLIVIIGCAHRTACVPSEARAIPFSQTGCGEWQRQGWHQGKIRHRHRLLIPMQVETILTIGLVVLSLCGMVRCLLYPLPY
jgi:hypothetical protein